MTKLIVFTDLHITPEGGRIIGLDPVARLRNGIQHVNRHHPDAARVIFTGDLAHRGDAASYARLRDLLSELHCPYSLLVGNHDHRERFLDCFPDCPVDANGFVQQVLDVDGARLILLDTLFAPPYEFPASYSGYLCEQRLAWLGQQLQEAAAKLPVLVFMHHPPHATGFAGMDAIALRNGEAFYDVLNRHGNVRHIVAGHVHRTISGSSHGISFSVFKSPCHQQPMNFGAMDTSLSVDEPAAYGIIFLQPDGVLVHTEDYEISQSDVVDDPSVHGRD